MPLEHGYAVGGEVPKAAVRNELSKITSEDLSVKSPINAGGGELAVTLGEHDGQQVLIVREAGHGGEWSKTSEQVVRRAVESVDGVGEQVYAEGGYEG